MGQVATFVYGRYLFAVGRNEEAARYPHRHSQDYFQRVRFVRLLAVLPGCSYTNSISPPHGNFYEPYAIAAAVLGG
jgi:ribose/xylose/arabinose/galactoside ABC-type transport system permease subunit